MTLFNDVMFLEPYVQYVRPIVTPPPGTIDEWRFFSKLANKIGHKLKAKPLMFGVPNDQIPGGLTLEPEEEWSAESIFRWHAESKGLDLDELARHPHGMLVDRGPVCITAPDSDDGARLDVCPPDVAAELASIAANGDQGRHRYRLSSRRITEAYNSASRA